MKRVWSLLVALAALAAVAFAAAPGALTGSILVNGHLLPTVKYLSDGQLYLFPVVPIARALKWPAVWDAPKSQLVLDGRKYPMVVDDRTISVLDGQLYVSWQELQELMPTLRFGMREDLAYFSGPSLDPSARKNDPMADALPTPTPKTEYFMNVGDPHHYYHRFDCKFLSRDPDKRVAIDDPAQENAMLKLEYGDKVKLLRPCPYCMRKGYHPTPTPSPANKPSSPPKPQPSPGASPQPTETPQSSPSATEDGRFMP